MNKLPNPPKHIYDPAFLYVPAARTNIAETFAKIRAAMGQQQPKKVRRIK